MQSATGDRTLDRLALGDFVREIHSGEEQHLSVPVEMSKLGPSHRVITSSPVVRCICELFSHPHVDLIATRVNTKTPLYVSPVPDPMAWKQDAFQPPWNDLIGYAFPPSLF